jgi:hypothetical protein
LQISGILAYDIRGVGELSVLRVETPVESEC